MSCRAEPGTPEPVWGELRGAVGHVPSAEHPEFKQLLRCQFWSEIRVEVFPGGNRPARASSSKYGRNRVAATAGFFEKQW